ncbi:roadblock/LC7 domain-containing protein [Streptomyces sp. TRM66268-LWL]|uniref:Roadblock/LC7 domain-containing protein n=1 Tax=Streptomyces polyasparticus TaxID=2767826 RepID=A0ABR7SSV7_9ACTN|nr:roadblock/LC7 domain-containing protein [Streptomyces polyasparticus]MBC9717403.1 roadblock/LC7 domain-containing protein [Streptomyces polyasparticus]
MAAQAELSSELGRLRAAVPRLTGALVVDADGKVLAEDFTAGPVPRAGSRTADSLTSARRLAEAAALGGVREFLVRGEEGWLAACTAGDSAVLLLVTEPGAHIGRLRLEAGWSGSRIAELLDGAPERLEKTCP